MTAEFPCELISWARVAHLCRVLADKIRKARFRPEIIVAIARGGYVPARLLCDYLDLVDLRSIRIAHYLAGADRQQQAELVDRLSRPLDGGRVLLVDDISDTGDTMELARAHLEKSGAGPIRVAVMQHKRTSTVEPDFYAHRIVRWRWIIYPWAITEDLNGFIDRMERRPAGPEEAVLALRKDYGLRISRALAAEVLATRR